MASFKLEIITPEKKAFSGNVESVKLPGVNGSFAVLSLHAPLISSLEKGVVEVIEENGNKLRFTTEAGVVEVLNNNVIVLVEKVLNDPKAEA